MSTLPAIQLIQTASEMRDFLKRIYPNGRPASGWERVALDTEFFVEESPANTVGLPFKTSLTYVQLSQGSERVVIEGPVTSRASGRDFNLPKMLAPWLADRRVKKLISTTRADYRVLKDAGVGPTNGIEMDTEVMDWLFDENRMFHGLKDGAQDHCNIHMKDYGAVFGYFGKNKNGTTAKKKTIPSMREIVEGSDGGHAVPWTGEQGRKMAVDYAGLDPYATWRLALFLRKQLKEQGLWEWYRQVECPLTMTLIRMEDRGIRIDVEELDRIRKEVFAEILRIEHIVRATTDTPELNLRSNPQLQELLFKKLNWPVLERNELTEAQEEEGQEEGNASIAKAVLDRYEKQGYKLATYLKAHRGKGTLHNTFLVGALEKRDAKTGLIHTIFKQARTATGRLSSGDRRLKKMNLQNIPAKKEKDPYRLRQFFLATLPGHDLIVADYSQIELYILAQVSQDKRMVAAFKRGEDLHTLTAAKIFGLKLPKEPSDWTPTSKPYADWKKECEAWKEKYSDERGNAKVVNFGLNYGMSAYKLAMDFGMEVEEAEKWVEAYFELYPGVQRYMRRTIDFCRNHGYVTTISGRRRRIPEIDSPDKYIVGHAERQCINAPIQGSAADIIKVAMNSLEYGAKYKCDYLPAAAVETAQKAKELGYRMLLQVHDELVGQAPKEHSQEAAGLVKTVMESVFPGVFKDVVIKASVGVGPNWNSAKK